MTTKKEYFTRLEVLDRIEEALLNEVEYMTFYEEILYTMFINKDPYIIGSSKAKEALEEYGVYNALDRVIESHEANGLELDLYDLRDPERLADALWRVVYNEVYYEEGAIFKYHDEAIEPEVTEVYLKEVRALIAEEVALEEVKEAI